MSFTASLEDIVRENRNQLLGIHSSWKRIPLKEIASILNGFAFASDQFTSEPVGVPLIRIRDILRNETETYFTGDFDKEYLVEAGDLIIGMDGDFNSTLWSGRKALLNQRVCKVTPDERFYDRRFLSFALPGYLKAINAHTSSITVKHLSSRTVSEIPLPFPPLPEQHRIVAKLEELFSDLDAGVAALQRAKANLKRYRAAVLKEAVEGTLTAEWRTKNPNVEPGSVLLERILVERRRRWEAEQMAAFEAKGKTPPKNWQGRYKEPATVGAMELSALPEGWCWGTVDAAAQVTKLAGFEYTKYVKYDPAGDLAVIKAENAGKLGFKWTDFSFVKSKTVEHLTRSRLRGGEVLMVFVGAGVGQVARVPKDRSYFLGPNISVIRPDENLLLPEYLEIFLRSWIGFQLTMSFTKAVAQPSLSMGTIRMIPIAFPPINEQKEIVREVEARLSVLDNCLLRTEQGLSRAARLRQSILKRAFEGKLVLQDPRDEPTDGKSERSREGRKSVRDNDDATMTVEEKRQMALKFVDKE